MVGEIRRGATPLGDGRTHFAVWAPKAREVGLQVRWNGSVERYQLEPSGLGVHQAIVADVPPGYDYAYRLDSGPCRPDPVSRSLPVGLHGPTRVVSAMVLHAGAA